MQKHLLSRTVVLSIIIGILFFLLNYFTQDEAAFWPVFAKSILAMVVFGLLYFTLFSMMNTPDRKIRMGIAIPVALLIGMIVGALFDFMKTGIIVGLIVGIMAGYIWEWIVKPKRGDDNK
ncbi:hypothetical protein ACSBRB_06955 [Staphylococcus auricularis]|uniref:hypothetical protein n=1 Tax=Staphylococcus auricularis TaxID=29379 RepID=UPI003EB84B2E